LKSRLFVVAGIVVIIIGAVFALQGFGVIEGSAMSNSHTFEVVGPLVALAGLVLAALGLRRRGPAALPDVAFGGAPLVAGLVRPADVHNLDGQVAGRSEHLIRHGGPAQQA
jgi:hypothetical protein